MNDNDQRYTPKVGDRVRGAHWRKGAYIDVEHITREHVIGTNSNGEEIARRLLGDFEKVEPRPTVRECWGRINGGAFIYEYSETSARNFSTGATPLARICAIDVQPVGDTDPITVAVVCDEHGAPLPVAVEQ